MASSSARAFEYLDSRTTTPFPLTSNPIGTSRSPIPPAPTSQNTSSSATLGTHHRSNNSDGSASTTSLASLAAFSNPPPGLLRHSVDTQDAPASIFAKALSMASPHPKLQIIGRSETGNSVNSQTVEVAASPDEDWQKREARKLKSFLYVDISHLESSSCQFEHTDFLDLCIGSKTMISRLPHDLIQRADRGESHRPRDDPFSLQRTAMHLP